MRKFAFLSLLILTSLGLAQEMPPAKELVISKKVFLIFRPGVKEELKVTADQEKKIKDTFGDSLQVEGDKIMITLSGDTDLETMSKDALKVLDTDQTKRLKEIWIQSLDGAAVGDDEVAKELEITADQKKTIDKVLDEAGSAIMEGAQSGAHDEEAAKKYKEIRKKAGEKMVAVLTEDQKKKYEALKGKEFKFKEGG